MQKDSGEKLTPTGQALLLIVGGAVVVSLEYWIETQFGFQLFGGRHGTGNGHVGEDFAWPRFWSRAGAGALIGLVFSIVDGLRKRFGKGEED